MIYPYFLIYKFDSMSKIVFSLVLYKQKMKDILPLLKSIEELNKLYKNQVFLSIYDNSETNKRFSLRDFKFLEFPVNYFHNSKNIGFGKANNLNFNNYDFDNDDIFIISNPDTFFESKEMQNFINAFQNHSRIVCANPLIKNNSISIQYSSKKDPTLLSLLIGFFPFLKVIKFLKKYDLIHKNKDNNYSKDTFQANYLSGSFLVVKANIFKKVKGFTNAYFLHLEDADFVRKCSKYGLTVHLPKGKIMHKWNRGSHKSIFQIYHVIRSIIIYFYKWGFKIF